MWKHQILHSNWQGQYLLWTEYRQTIPNTPTCNCRLSCCCTKGFTFGIAPKVTKSLGPEPPKAEKPGDIPKIRKLATLKQYGFFNGIPPSFSPAERFFRQRPRVTGVTGVTRGTGIVELFLLPLLQNSDYKL